jgi:hypothetical protein
LASIGILGGLGALLILRKGLNVYGDMKKLSHFSNDGQLKFYYRGGFQPKMDVKEASLILGIRFGNFVNF